MGLQAPGRQRLQHAPDHLPGETSALPCRNNKQSQHALFKQMPALIFFFFKKERKTSLQRMF